jgi:glycosyltransferase involved in cell wall biosynthesis
LLGHLADCKALAELLANTDAFIHPNPREPFGINPLEAICPTLPVVAPSRGGAMTYCGDRNAWLDEPNGPSFAASVRTRFNDQATRAARLAEGRRTALADDWSEVAGRSSDTYDSFDRRQRDYQMSPVKTAG